MKNRPPRFFLRFFRWYCHPKLHDHIEGDLIEVYNERLKASGKPKADRKFIVDVLLLFRPGIIRPIEGYKNLNSYGMYKSYFKIGWRNLLKNKGYSFINIGGLAIGITVAMFIGLWVYDELSFNKYHKNYNQIAQVWSFSIDPATQTIGGGPSIQYPVSTTLRSNYGQYFKHVLLAWGAGDHTVSMADKKYSKKGQFIEPGALEMLSLKMLKGSYESLNNPNSVILSKSTAESIFGSDEPMNKTLTIDNRMEVQVTGIYEDIPRNNRFGEVKFFSSWELWLSFNEWAQGRQADWDNRPFNIYVQLRSNVTMEAANQAIKDLYNKNVPADFFKTIEQDKPFVQLVPMSTWHLYSEFKDGKPVGGRVAYVWLFSIIGIFVLVLACINFINLSTARSERRAREVGVRKTIGSGKWQLICQFLGESLIVVVLAFVLSVGLVAFLQAWFNDLADKDIALPFDEPVFWMVTVTFILITGFMAGIYPAFYLSSFQPVKVLKGVLRSGPFAALPRKVLVVVQFTVSVVLIIGSLIVYQQIQYARNRPIGYDKESLITVGLNDPGYKNNLGVLRTELLRTGVVLETATSSGPLTAVWNSTSGYDWPGKDPNLDAEFAICNATLDFGKTVGWEIIDGRDFSPDFITDSVDAIIINSAAAKYMALNNPVGQQLTDVDEFGNKKWSRRIIGVVKNMVMESPYDPARPTLFFYNRNVFLGLLHIKLNPAVSASTALPKIEAVFTKMVPTAIFDYKFVDEEYARKFSQEERIGSLSGIFALLAILISCLGLFGLASYVAEQRTKEIGIRKVMGATVSNLWRMLSQDFILLVIISCVVAIPIAYYFMNSWLKQYEYHTEISVWVFLVTGIGALSITLLTVSFQAVKAAMMNPVKSLRSE
jgi:ABC-type antimicrobial peptide transport system permease subunit